MRVVHKTKDCRCCDGTGLELDQPSVGREMKSLRLKRGLSLAAMGNRMRPKLRTTYLFNLEHGLRNWNERLIAEYRRVTK